jgi:membrane glycosyltransferase
MRSSNLEAGPDLAVSSMVPRPIDLGRITGAAGETLERFERWPVMRALSPVDRVRGPWRGSSTSRADDEIFITEHMDAARLNRRRFLFFSSVFVLTSMATWFVADLYWRDGRADGPRDHPPRALRPALRAHFAAGFCTALAGLLRDQPRRRQQPDIGVGAGGRASSHRLASTAIVMPVFNEDVSRVFEGLRVVFKSVQKLEGADNFDFFVLSDSNQPNQWIREEVAWAELCKQVGGFGKIFYRKRRQAINKKAGNVADFLRRWGRTTGTWWSSTRTRS